MKYFSMFTGIGGFELGIGDRADCVGFSEFDPKQKTQYSAQLLKQKFPWVRNYGDATKINTDELPDFDLLVGGFPCQAFSIAGQRRGFEDTRGTLFFEIARILKAKQPRMFLVENVKGLLNHDKGETFTTILKTIDELGYDAEWQVLNSKHFGVPQNRERVFIVGSIRGLCQRKIFPIGQNGRRIDEGVKKLQREVQTAHCLTSRYYKMGKTDNYIKSGTLRTHKDGRGFRMMKDFISPCIPARARNDGSGQPCVAVLTPNRKNKRQNGRRFNEDGEPSFTLTGTDIHGVMKNNSIRRLTPLECERLQGFPDNWTAGFSDTQRYKMCGNAVTVNVIKAIMTKLNEVKNDNN